MAKKIVENINYFEIPLGALEFRKWSICRQKKKMIIIREIGVFVFKISQLWTVKRIPKWVNTMHG